MGAEMTGHQSLERVADSVADRWTGSFLYDVGVSNVKYAAHMEFGTRPHAITPNTAGALHFWVDGVEVMTSYVNHPGTHPRPYLRPGAEAAARQTSAAVAANNDLQGVTKAIAENVQKFAKMYVPKDTGRLMANITLRRIE